MKTRTNLWNTLLALLVIFVSATAFTACSNDDDDNNNNNNGYEAGDNTEIKSDYTATTSVKTVVLKKDNEVTIYEDFCYKYALELYEGRIDLCAYKRNDGAWKRNCHSYLASTGAYPRYYYNINIKDCGKQNSVSDVTEVVGVNKGYTFCPDARPGHGYAACFLTEENETKHLRLYISNYKLDSEGALESITVQYQLY